MAMLIPSNVYPKGDQNIEFSQESTGELAASMKGVHDGEMQSLAVDREGNLKDYPGRELLGRILLELQKLNIQISMITDQEITEEDTHAN